jgi:hypothetical protein
MKKLVCVFTAVVVLAALPAFAKGPTKKSGRSDVGQL